MVAERSSNPNFVDIPTSELFAELNRQVAEAPAGSEFPDAVLLDLVDPPPLVALLRKLLVHDEWTTLRMCGPAPPCVLSSLDRSTVVWPLLTGSVLAAGCCRFAIQSRTYPTSTHTTSELGTRGYIGWHRDFEGPGIGISVNPSAVIKVSPKPNH